MIPVHLIGVVDDDPTSTTTPAGTNVATFTIRCESVYRDEHGVVHPGESTRARVKAFRALAEHVAHCLRAGDRVMVDGRLYIRSYEGRTAPVVEIEANEIAASLRYTPLVIADRPDPGAHSRYEEMS